MEPMGRSWRLQAMGTAATIAAFTAIVLASMSDRAPGLMRRYHAGLPIPEWMLSSGRTFGIHFLAWSALAFLAALVTTRWRSRLGVGTLLFLNSVIVELAQDRWTAIRRYEHVDLAANLVGISLGVALGGIMVTAAAEVQRRLAVRR